MKWFNRIRGFEFVNVEGGDEDIFVHMEVLRRSGIDVLVPGQFVMVSYGTGPKGLMAREVQRIDVGVKLASPHVDTPEPSDDGAPS